MTSQLAGTATVSANTQITNFKYQKHYEKFRRKNGFRGSP